MSKIGKIRATIIELFHRPIKLTKTKDGIIYWNGEDNMYPEEIERVVCNSPTASRAARLMAKFISGKGLTDEAQDVIVNTRKNYKLSKVASLVAQDIATQYGSFIHVVYGFDDNGNIVPKEIDVLDYSSCRISKEDDDDWAGKVYFNDWDAKSSILTRKDKKEIKWYYPFNSRPEVVKAQIMSDAKVTSADVITPSMLEKYRGQVFYLNLTPRYKYALAPVDSVYMDADSEYRFSVYTNTQMRTGHLGKTMAVSQGIDEEQRDQVDKDLKEWLGAENSGNIYHLCVESADNLDNVIKIIQVQPQFNDKLFAENEKRIRKNILGAFNNIPEPLLFASESALFGTSDDTYREMKLFYSEQVEDERWELSQTLTYLGFPCEIKPIIENTTSQITDPNAATE